LSVSKRAGFLIPFRKRSGTIFLPSNRSTVRMAGKKERSTLWRQTTVVIRADILEQAHLQKIDISEACNQALAEKLGIDYRQQKIPEGIIPGPVIIASDGKPVLPDHDPSKPGAMGVPAIINADDPQAAKTLKVRHILKEKPARDIPAPAPEKEALQHRIPPTVAEKANNPSPLRKKKVDAAKKFFTSMILREDTDTALIAKDDLYYTFERWCRDHRILPVPDRKSFSVTLKNQFAVKEKMVNGTPVWTGVRVK
jgi:hypothetical protein